MDREIPNSFEPGSFMLAYKNTSTESYWHHAHRGIELLYIYEGCGEIQVDNRTYAMENDSLVWFQPYQLHRVAVPFAPNRRYVRSNLSFDPQFPERYLSPFPELKRFYRHLRQENLREPFVLP